MSAFNSALLDMSHVHDRLWIGAYPEEPWLLPSLGIDTVYLCASERQHLPATPGLTVVTLGFNDSPLTDVDWQALLAKAVTVSEHVAQFQGGILISCVQGINRAPLMAGAVLHFLTGKSGAEIIRLLRVKREGILTNKSFADALGSLPSSDR